MILTKGIVCFCDILGYKSLLENNSTIDSARIIIENIATIDKSIKSKINKLYEFNDMTRNIGSCYLQNKMKCVIVSDTIILFFDLDGFSDNEREYHSVSCLMIITYILAFIREMFENGLPLRGCVSYGEYFIFESMFSGRVISECYTESERLDFSGVMITTDCYEYIKNNSKNTDFIDLVESLIKKICVPIKSNTNEFRNIFNWMDDLTCEEKNRTKDIEHYIMDKFLTHNKVVNDKAHQKYINTIQVVNDLINEK